MSRFWSIIALGLMTLFAMGAGSRVADANVADDAVSVTFTDSANDAFEITFENASESGNTVTTDIIIENKKRAWYGATFSQTGGVVKTVNGRNVFDMTATFPVTPQYKWRIAQASFPVGSELVIDAKRFGQDATDAAMLLALDSTSIFIKLTTGSDIGTLMKLDFSSASELGAEVLLLLQNPAFNLVAFQEQVRTCSDNPGVECVGALEALSTAVSNSPEMTSQLIGLISKYTGVVVQESGLKAVLKDFARVIKRVEIGLYVFDITLGPGGGEIRLFNALTSPPPTQGGSIDVALVIDSSGSMGWNDAANRRLEAARKFVFASANDDQIAVIDFDDSVRTLKPLTKLGSDRSSFYAQINLIDANGGTEFDDGLAAACQELKNRGTSAKRAALLLTDGQNGSTYQDSAHQCFASQGWPVYTLGFGDDAQALLQRIASETGGEYRHWDASIQDLPCEFQRIRAKISGGTFSTCSFSLITPGQTIAYAASVAARQMQATFSSSWIGSDVEMTLVSPSGREIGRGTTAGDVVHDLGPSWESYTVTDPEAGDWTVRLYGLDVPAAGEDVVFNYITLPDPDPDADPDSGSAGGGGGPSGGFEVPLESFEPDLGTDDAPHVAPTIAVAPEYAEPAVVLEAGPPASEPAAPIVAGAEELPPAVAPVQGVTGLADAGTGNSALPPMQYVWVLGAMSAACVLLAGGVALGGRQRVHRRK